MSRIKQFSVLAIFLFTGALSSCKSTSYEESVPSVPTQVKSDVAFWYTSADGSISFRKQNIALLFSSSSQSYPTITVDSTKKYQTIDGFGYTLTGGSATLINKLDETKKTALLYELFSIDSTFIGVSYLRLSIGASDLSAEPFTYDEVADGQVDMDLANFSLEREKVDLIPVLKRILAINPNIKIVATPWSAPRWMKTNGSYSGGSLKTEYYDVYAKYFVKYIEAMQGEGITIDAITPQNEPLNANNTPAMLMQASEQANFIKNNLGPLFSAKNIKTKIIVYDHNLDRPDYVTSVYSDTQASQYIDGAAFHLYAGNISTMGTVHAQYPQKNLYFTEQYTASSGSFNGDFQWHTKNLIIGATRNWSRNVLEWNLAADATFGPHTSGGCSTCLGALTIDNNIVRNVSYYVIAHASKFVRPGSVRIDSNISGDLQNVAFVNPDGKIVLIVLNNGSTTSTFKIEFNGKVVIPTLTPGAVGTFVW